jgi:G3E family GTPase
MTMAVRSAIPVTVLPGYPGAGETTLLGRILTGSHGCRCCTVRGDLIRIIEDGRTGVINVEARA